MELLACPDLLERDGCSERTMTRFFTFFVLLLLMPGGHLVAGVRQVRPLAENVLVLQPDLIVRSYGGGPYAGKFFERAGVPVIQVPFDNDIEAIRHSILVIASGLGEAELGIADGEQLSEPTITTKFRTKSPNPERVFWGIWFFIKL
jgi:ABC-type Fe3+-hydroxamate transport system substrate-binding protein